MSSATFPGQLLRSLRRHLGAPELQFATPPARLHGGMDTDLFGFELERSVAETPRALVVRMYRPHHGPKKPVVESAVQNCMANAGYPAPRVHLVSTDPSELGQPFIVMERLPGRPLIDGDPVRSATVLATAQAKLHEIQPGPVISALREVGVDESWLENRFVWLEERAAELPSVRVLVHWLLEHRPRDRPEPVICHGDFHLRNVLFEGALVTGVLDWSAFTLADRAFDVAGTLMLYKVHGKLLREGGETRLADIDRMIERYLAEYEHHHALDESRLEYHLALRCAIALVHCLERPGSMIAGLDVRLAEEIRRISRVDVAVPER